jgi:putative serine protease PepD
MSAHVLHDATTASQEEARHAPRRKDKRRLPTGSIVAGSLVAVFLVGGAAATVSSHRLLDSRVAGLEAAADESAQAQAAASKRITDLRHRLDDQKGELGEARSQLDAHPAAAEVAKVAQKSVFTIYSGDSLGSSFVVTSGGGHADLVTNYHVVSTEYLAENRSVDVRRGNTTYSGQIVDVSEADDLAVIRVNQELPALDMVTKSARVGDPVLVLGSPNGLAGTVTSGIVSAYRELEATEYLQFSAPISPGNSGGPVLDETGQVLGVAVMKDVRIATDGISYAVPTRRVCDALDVC